MSQDEYSQPDESERDYPVENGNGVHAEQEEYGQQEQPYQHEVAPPAPTAGQVARKKLMGYVGFANLPNQVHRKRSVPCARSC